MLNDFYTIDGLRQTEQTVECTVRFQPDHAIFGGHFPGQPVVPGVCTMAIIKALLEQALGRSLQLAEAGAVKFLQLLLPQHRPQAQLSWREAAEGISATALLVLDGRPVFKMNARYEVRA